MRGRLIWILPLLLAAGLAVFLFLPQMPALVSTGDPLLDWYANAASAKLASGDTSGPILTFAEAKAQEGRFGQDPRYWQLRAKLAAPEALGQRNAQIKAGGNRQKLDPALLTKAAEVKELQAAHDKGICDSNTTLLLFLADLPNLSPEQAEEKLDEAILSGKGNAWPYYLRGVMRLKSGDFKDALSDLRQGNQCKHSEYPHWFPQHELAAALAQGKVYGSKALMGYLIRDSGIDQADSYCAAVLSDSIKRKATREMLLAQPQLFDALQQMACRLLDADDGNCSPETAEALLGDIAGDMLDDPDQDLTLDAQGIVHRRMGVDPNVMLGVQRLVAVQALRFDIDLDWRQKHRDPEAGSHGQPPGPLAHIPVFARAAAQQRFSAEYEYQYSRAKHSREDFKPFFAVYRQYRVSDSSTSEVLEKFLDATPDPRPGGYRP